MTDPKAAFIMYPTGQGGGGGGAEDFRGVLKFLEQKKGGYENCLNISWGCLFFVRFCLAFVIVLKSEKRNDKYSSFFQVL